MFEWVGEIKKIIATGVDALRPEVLGSETAAQLVERFAHIQRTAAAGKTLCAGRVADSGAWRKERDRSAAQWVARPPGPNIVAVTTWGVVGNAKLGLGPPGPRARPR